MERLVPGLLDGLPEPASEPLGPKGSALRILILEDAESDVQLIQRELCRGGILPQVLRASTREAFGGALQDGKVDLILVDYGLPGFDGLAALGLARERCPDVPVIIVSSALGDERAIETLKAGASDYVLKEQLFRLVPAVAQALANAAEQRNCREAEERLQQHAEELAVANLQLQAQAGEIHRQAARAEALVRTAERLNAQLSLEGVLQAVCEEAANALEMPLAAVALYDEKSAELRIAAACGLPARALERMAPIPRALFDRALERSGTIAFLPEAGSLPEAPNVELLRELDIRLLAYASMARDDSLIGGLLLAETGQARRFREDEDLLLQGLASQAASAIANARLFEQMRENRQQLQSLSRRLVEVQEEESRAISRELHDETGQGMTALKLGLGLLKREWSCSEEASARIDQMRELVDQVQEGLHRMAMNLRPPSLDRYGLVPALESYAAAYAAQSSLAVEVVATGLDETRLPGEVETALYRIVQESLTNVARHARAQRAGVILQRRGDVVSLIVEDDGRGFDAMEAWQTGRLGLLGMRERAAMLGGTLDIETEPGHGTTLYVEVPIARETAAGSPG